MPETDTPTTLNESCDHKIANHRHGTHACYTLDRCRCADCTGARRRYERKRKKWLGEFPSVLPPRVDADPVRAHLASLMRQGMGPKRIAEVSGVPHGAVSKLIYGNYKGRGPSKTINRKNAERLLAVTLDVADGAKVSSREAQQIIDELVNRGWTKAEIGRRVTSPEARSLQVARNGLVMAGTLRALRKLPHEPVPPRIHSATGKTYIPDTGHEWQQIRAATHGVPEDFKPGSPEWLRVMRAGLKQAVEESVRRHGRVSV